MGLALRRDRLRAAPADALPTHLYELPLVARPRDREVPLMPLVFGQPPPEDLVVVVRTRMPTPCAMPHFDRSGQPREVPGLLYRKGPDSVVLCKHHGQQRFGV